MHMIVYKNKFDTTGRVWSLTTSLAKRKV